MLAVHIFKAISSWIRSFLITGSFQGQETNDSSISDESCLDNCNKVVTVEVNEFDIHINSLIVEPSERIQMKKVMLMALAKRRKKDITCRTNSGVF